MQTISFEQAAERLGVKVSRVKQFAKENRLLLAKDEAGKKAILLASMIEYPTGWAPVEHLQGTVLSLLDGGYSYAEAFAWLTSPCDQLAGQEPLELIRAGRHTYVNRVASALGF